MSAVATLPPTADPRDARIAALEAEVAVLEAEVGWLRCKATPMDLQLVAAIGRHQAALTWTAREVWELAATAPDVMVAAVAALGVEWSARSLGWRLKRLRGLALNGATLTYEGKGHDDESCWALKPTRRVLKP